MRAALVVLLWFGLCSAAAAQDAAEPIVGPATVIDTDVMIVAGERLFLFGIEAFEKEQVCFLNGRPWDCGSIAYRELEIIVAEGEAVCVRRADPDRRRIRFPWATCTINGVDIAAEMARRGMALAQREQTEDYVADEEAAAAAEAGIWKGIFVAPWTYRDNLRGL